MKRSVSALLAAIALAAGSGRLSAQLGDSGDCRSTPDADLLKFPDDIHMGEAAGVATNSKGDIFLYTRTGNPSIDARHLARGVARRLAAVPVRSDRQVRARDRPGRVRHAAGAAGARRSAGQRLDRRSDVDAGDQVRSERARADDSQPQAGSDARAGAAADAARDRRAGRSGRSGARRRRSRR